MEQALPFTMTNETITVLHDGKNHLVRKGAANFVPLRDALLSEDWDTAVDRLSVDRAVMDWARGKFRVMDGTVTFNGEPLPTEISSRILEMAGNGDDPTPVCNFWERLQKNPSMRSVKQLFTFLQNQGIPFTRDGRFLAYKGVNENYTDCYTGNFDNSPGQVHEMERNKISDDPNEACHYGFHVGALEYARSFGPRVVIVEVDPADVVCVPYDHSYQKMRVCRYKVIGIHNGQFMSSTTFDNQDLPGTGVDLDEDNDDYWDSDSDFDPLDEDDRDDEEDLQRDELDDEESDDLDSEDSNLTVFVPRRYAKIHAMDSGDLLGVSTDELRSYASNALKIVGASKIPGGKIALIRVIEKARRKSK